MKWHCLKSKYIISNKWLKVRKDTIKLPSNIIIDDYYVIEKNDVVLIFAVDSKGNAIIKEEYRYPIDRILFELPGGTFDMKEESPLEAAKRELLEETGYESSCWKELGQFYDYPTKDINKIYAFFADHIEKVAQQSLDVSEDIKYSLVPLKTLEEMVFRNEINVSGSVATILLALKKQ